METQQYDTVLYSNQPESRLMIMLLGGYSAETQLVSAYSKCNDYRLVSKLIWQAKYIFNAANGPLMATAMLASDYRRKKWAESFLSDMLQSGEDLTEFFDMFKTIKPQSGLPSMFRRVFKQKVRQMSYHDLQYSPPTKQGTSLRDIINLSHPKPTEAINRYMKNEQPSRAFWKVMRDKRGLDKVISSELIPYRDLLEHLQVISNYNSIIKDFAYNQVKNKSKIMEEKILPLDLKLYYDFSKDVRCKQALVEAAEISLCNIPAMEGRTLVLVDRSAGMQWGSTPYIQQAATIAASLYRKNSELTDVALYAENLRQWSCQDKNSVLTIAEELQKVPLKGTANLNRVIHQLSRPYQRIYVLTNKAVWNGAMSPKSALMDYYSREGANPYVYGVNLKHNAPSKVIDSHSVVMAEFSRSSIHIPRLVE